MQREEFKNFVPKKHLKWKKISEDEFEVIHLDKEQTPTVVGNVHRSGIRGSWKLSPYFSVVWSIDLSGETFDSEIEAGRRLVFVWEQARDHDFFDFEELYETLF